MTQKNKLIVGGVAVALVVYYLYDQNKKKKEVADLKAGADEVVGVGVAVPIVATEVSTSTISELPDEQSKQLNFAGNRGNSMSAQYFR
jgi:hypothetical protein